MFDIATTRIIHSREPRTEPRDWTWPLPSMNGFAPKIVEDAHDLDVARRDIVIAYEPHIALPHFVPVFAARDGVVTYGGRTPSGHVVALDHAGGWSTQYAGLAHMFVCATDRFRRRRKERVRAGDVLGYLSNDAARLRFELARFSEEDGHEPVPPIQRSRRWVTVAWEQTPTAPTPRSNVIEKLAA